LCVPVLGRGLDEPLALCETRVVDKNVQSAKILDDRLRHRLHRSEVGDVGLIGFRAPAFRLDLLDNELGLGRRAAVIHCQRCAFRRKPQRNFAADTACGAGHQCNLAFQSEIHARSSSLSRLSFLFGASLFDETVKPLWRYWQFVDFDPERRKGIRNCVGDRGRRTDRATLAHAAETAERRR